MNIKQTAERQKEQTTDREAYSTPKLKVFGPVGLLTQAGSGATSEIMSNGMSSMSRNQRA